MEARDSKIRDLDTAKLFQNISMIFSKTTYMTHHYTHAPIGMTFSGFVSPGPKLDVCLQLNHS